MRTRFKISKPFTRFFGTAIAAFGLGVGIGIDASAARVVRAKTPAKLVEAARSKFETGKFAEAAEFYQQIPRSAPEFLRTREELSWAFLRAGNWSALRGQLTHLNSPLVPLEYRLEGRALAAISALQLCDFALAHKSLKDFQTEIAPVAQEIEQNLQTAQRLPKAQKILLNNRKELVSEAITKMQFIKIELMSQLRRWEKYKTKQDSLSKSQQVATSDDQASRELIKKAEGEAKLVFLSEGDFWSDEEFQLQGLATSACLETKRETL